MGQADGDGMGKGVVSDNRDNAKRGKHMNKDEAIKLLEKLDRIIDKSPSLFESDFVTGNDFGNAIYIAIECLEKDIPKKTLGRQHCPTCKGYLGCEGFEQNCCDRCGQKLDWSSGA